MSTFAVKPIVTGGFCGKNNIEPLKSEVNFLFVVGDRVCHWSKSGVGRRDENTCQYCIEVNLLKLVNNS